MSTPSWRPMQVLTIARHYAVAFGIAMRPVAERTVPMVLKILIWVAILALVAFIIWALTGDGGANSLQGAGVWGPGPGLVQGSGT